MKEQNRDEEMGIWAHVDKIEKLTIKRKGGRMTGNWGFKVNISVGRYVFQNDEKDVLS